MPLRMRLNRSAVFEFANQEGLTQRELAKRAHVSESYLSELLAEKSPKAGGPKTWKKIADALQVRVRSITEPIVDEDAELAS